MKKLIGKGSFTKAYQISETEVEIVSICPAKECYAMFSQGNTFAPKIEKVDYREDGFSVYSMPLYPKVTAPKKQLNAKAYTIYTTLRNIASTYAMDYYKFIEAVEASEIKNLTRHIDNAKAGVKGYEFVDGKTAQLYLDGTPYMTVDNICDDELFNELFGE